MSQIHVEPNAVGEPSSASEVVEGNSNSSASLPGELSTYNRFDVTHVEVFKVVAAEECLNLNF